MSNYTVNFIYIQGRKKIDTVNLLSFGVYLFLKKNVLVII